MKVEASVSATFWKNVTKSDIMMIFLKKDGQVFLISDATIFALYSLTIKTERTKDTQPYSDHMTFV